MKPHRLLAIILGIAFCSTALAQTQQGMDKELSDLAEKLATKIKACGKTKITVLDFTDLNGETSDLGKYVAEQLTVDFVTGDREFTVVDRANLKKILAEHKLTASGLIDPDNAKKLGQFSGVDALILGNVVPMSPNVKLTAKIITTDTADIIGGGQCTFKSDENVQQLLTHSATPPAGDATSTEQTKPAPVVNKPFADLQVKVESFNTSRGFGSYMLGRLTLIISNTNSTESFGVALEADPYNKFNFINNRGEEFKATEISGIGTVFKDFTGGYSGTFTDIPPKGSIVVVIKSQASMRESPGNYPPYRLQALVFFSQVVQGRHVDVKSVNLMFDVK